MAGLSPSWRYERKYLSQVPVGQLRQALLQATPLCHALYQPRQVHSLYFDTPEWEYYQQNALGFTPRTKVRVRWYTQSDGAVTPLQLEIKHRQGEVQEKRVTQWNAQTQTLSLQELTVLVRDQLEHQLPEAGALQPVLSNTYQRQYWWCPSVSLRITIDNQVQFARPSQWPQPVPLAHLPATILEVNLPGLKARASFLPWHT